MPQTVPKESSYKFSDDWGGGGRGGRPGSFEAILGGGGGVGLVGPAPAARWKSAHALRTYQVV